MRYIIMGLGRMGVAQTRIARYYGTKVVAGIDCDAEAREFFETEFEVKAYAAPGDVPQSLWNAADVVWITVPDRAIAACAQEVAPYASHAMVVHTSGATPYTVLGQCGAMRGSIHPLVNCPKKECSDSSCAEVYRYVLYAIDGEPDAVKRIGWMLSRVRGIPVEVDADKRSLYHAAAVFSSNYPIVLADITQKLLISCGFDDDLARRASYSLLSHAAYAVAKSTPIDALTGPAKRNDLPTIQGHIEALKNFNDGEYVEVYEALLRMAQAMCHR